MNTLTDEQLQEIADKGAEAALALKPSAEVLALDKKIYSVLWKKEAPARQAFARTVIDLALSKMAEGEADLVRPEEMRHENSTRSCENRAAVINLAHRQAMAALRAQMQGEINELKVCEKSWTHAVWQMEADRDQWKERAERAELAYKRLSIPIREADSIYQDWEKLRNECEALRQELAALKQQAPADREAFEKWEEHFMSRSGLDDLDLRWEAWQAALAHKPQPSPSVKEMLAVWFSNWHNGAEGSIDSERAMTAVRELFTLPAALTAEEVPACTYTPTFQPRCCPVHGGHEADDIHVAPTPPEGFHIATEEERKCLPVGYKFRRERSDWPWLDGKCAGEAALGEYHYACPNTPPLVTFTNGKINPPPYGSWHRSDWTPEMLPDGWRPLLLGECGHCEYLNYRGEWIDHPTAGETECFSAHSRTKRPLPPAPEKEKEPEPSLETIFLQQLDASPVLAAIWDGLYDDQRNDALAKWERLNRK